MLLVSAYGAFAQQGEEASTDSKNSGRAAKSAHAELTRTEINGSGSRDHVAKWRDNAGTLGDSTIIDNGAIGIGTVPSRALLDVNGSAAFGTLGFDHTGGVTTGPTRIDAKRGLLAPEANFPTYYAPTGVTWSMRTSDGGPPNDTFQWGYNLSNRLYIPQNRNEPQMYWGFESHYPNRAAGRPHTSEIYVRWFRPGAPYGAGFVEPFGAYVDRTTGRIFNVHLDSDRIQFSAGDSNPTNPFVVWTPALLDFRTNARFINSIEVSGDINTHGTLMHPDKTGYLAAVSRTGANYGLFYDANAQNPALQLWSNNAARLTIDSKGRIMLGSVRDAVTRSDAVPLLIDSAGQLGTISSSREVKDNVEDMARASARVMDLRPVTFRYKQPFQDSSNPVQYGLIAEEVAEKFPELAAKNAAGKVETVKYHLLPVLLLNEIQRQEKLINRQQEEIRELREQIEKLGAAVSGSRR